MTTEGASFISSIVSVTTEGVSFIDVVVSVFVATLPVSLVGVVVVVVFVLSLPSLSLVGPNTPVVSSVTLSFDSVSSATFNAPAIV